MEFIDEVMLRIEKYCNDPTAVQNVLYVMLENYTMERKSTQLTVYEPDSNEALLKRFLMAKKIKGLSKRTLEYYGDTIPRSLELMGKNVIDITTDDLRILFAKRMMQGASACTCDNERRNLSSFFQWLQNNDYIHKNPMALIDPIKAKKTKKEAFSDQEIIMMRDRLETTKEKAIFEILLSTGCRVTELSQIKICDVSLEDNSILVHGKGNKDRYVYMNAAARFAYDKYMADRKDGSIYVFPACISCTDPTFHTLRKHHDLKRWYQFPQMIDEVRHLNAGTIESNIREIGQAVGVKAHPHKFRRTCATNALRNGMPIEMVSKMLGHENIATTQIYLDLNDEDLASMHRKYVR